MTTTGLRQIKPSEQFAFTDAHSLFVWLKQFKNTDLHLILFEDHNGNNYLTFHYETEVLSDGSEVHNIRVS